MRVRPAVQAMKAYVPGKSLESVHRELGLAEGELVKLNQNENPLGPSPLAMAAAASVLDQASIYPEGSAPALREKLSELWEVPPDWFLAGNGSDEIFRLLAEVYLEPDDAVIVPAPSFAGYPMVAELMGAQVVRVPLAEDAMDLPAMAAAARDHGAVMLFLCRPNSPTGGVFAEDALRSMLEELDQETLVVLDEAYRDFDQTPFNSRRLLLDHPNLVVTRTFSKIYGMAGFRLGYGVARPEILEPLYRARDPFTINTPALAAGIAALDDVEHVQRSQQLAWEGRVFLYKLFDRLSLGYVPTQANFVLFHTRAPAVEIYQALLQQGVLVRPCASFGLPHSLRVTIGTPEQNEKFAEALGRVMSREL